ncbi:MAG: anti-sigma F factor [Oscillospiraceae bacterium]|nr:anti-sigma F factor [Oscillospiraceae bacterium]
MKVMNEFELKFRAKSENESFARTTVCAFAAQLDPNISEISDIRTAVSEAVTNCIVHAYKNGEGTVVINVKLLDGNMLYIKVRDKGCGIADVQKAMEPMYTTAESDERAGLGFAVMENFMDKLAVTSKPGKGTTVTMRKRIGNGK